MSPDLPGTKIPVRHKNLGILISLASRTNQLLWTLKLIQTFFRHTQKKKNSKTFHTKYSSFTDTLWNRKQEQVRYYTWLYQNFSQHSWTTSVSQAMLCPVQDVVSFWLEICWNKFPRIHCSPEASDFDNVRFWKLNRIELGL